MTPTKSWDLKYIGLAEHVSKWSKDPSTKVGAVLVNYDHGLEFVGYNGFPRGVNDDPERYENRELKYKLVVHAEVNALLKAGPLARGGTLYIYPAFSFPPVCNECAKAVIQAGVKEVVGLVPDLNDPRVQRWADAILLSKQMFEEAGVTWRQI